LHFKILVIRIRQSLGKTKERKRGKNTKRKEFIYPEGLS